MTLKRNLAPDLKYYCKTYLDMTQADDEKLWREYQKIPKYMHQGDLEKIFQGDGYYY